MPTLQKESSTEELAKIFKALSHPTRIRILKHLKKINECVCGEIVEIFPFSQSTISQHLKHLRDSGLVKGEINGPSTCYCIDNEIFDRFKTIVSEL